MFGEYGDLWDRGGEVIGCDEFIVGIFCYGFFYGSYCYFFFVVLYVWILVERLVVYYIVSDIGCYCCCGMYNGGCVGVVVVV